MRSGLEIIEGKIIDKSGIETVGKEWRFTNEDPQIYIKFARGIGGLRIICDIEEASFDEAIATIYFRYSNESFSQNRSVQIPFLPMKTIEREIWFEFGDNITEIRFDPVEILGTCKVRKLYFEPISLEERKHVLSREDFSIYKDKTLLFFTHELTTTGAPILLLHIAKKLREEGYNLIVLAKKTKDKPLEISYKENKIKLVKIDCLNCLEYACIRVSPDFQQRVVSAEEHLRLLLKNLRKKGVSTALTNTIVTGEYTELLKEYGYRIVSLIHEMKTTIEHYGFKPMGEKIAKYSDYIVFPNEYVKNDFQQLYSDINGECLVKPQGVYMKDALERREEILEEYGIEEKDFVIMSSGTCELRKGVDLFVDAAMILVTQNPGRKIKFIWTGDFGNKELECWLMSQLERSSLTETIQFIPFIKDQEEYKKILRRADLFWALSREDPFPSTVLEAMKNEVPALGFMHSGGIQEMLSNGRGILVDGFNLNEVVSATEYMLQASDIREMLDKAKKYVDQLTFDSYIQFLTEVFRKDMQVFPKLDLSVWEKESHFYAKQHQPESIEIREKKLRKINVFDKIKNKHTRGGYHSIILLDTAIGSDNVGDEIIMDYCGKICDGLFTDKKIVHIPTHIYDPRSEKVKDYLKILCGTNLIYTQMENSRQWALPAAIENYNNICFLGIGMQQIGLELPMSSYTKKFLKYIMSSEHLHSVRDEETKKRLSEIGINNVLNTGCPTTWNLSETHCKVIPTTKARNVVTTVTDYMIDPEKDVYMLETLKKHYEKVYIWIQGQVDYQYLKSLVDLGPYHIIPPSLAALDEVLQKEEVDYIGTRLHAGIRSMNIGNRSLVIGVDNRARAMKHDINLPVLERNEMQEKLEEIIEQKWATEVHLPIREIERWKKQFQ
ncbi:MAG: glycosyltransferase [Merdimonas faecis]|uniref:glycosyltransferase n=1 Tax=Merdimonas faecis TaxID=1653435 RepID=UPI0039904224